MRAQQASLTSTKPNISCAAARRPRPPVHPIFVSPKSGSPFPSPSSAGSWAVSGAGRRGRPSLAARPARFREQGRARTRRPHAHFPPRGRSGASSQTARARRDRRDSAAGRAGTAGRARKRSRRRQGRRPAFNPYTRAGAARAQRRRRFLPLRLFGELRLLRALARSSSIAAAISGLSSPLYQTRSSSPGAIGYRRDETRCEPIREAVVDGGGAALRRAAAARRPQTAVGRAPPPPRGRARRGGAARERAGRRRALGSAPGQKEEPRPGLAENSLPGRAKAGHSRQAGGPGSLSQRIAGRRVPPDLGLVLSLHHQILTASSKPHATHARKKIKQRTILPMKLEWMRNLKGH